MNKRKKKRPMVGDVFSFPIRENTYCFGQIVSDKCFTQSKLYILFDFVSDSVPDIQVVLNQPILAIAHLDDASIMDGDWTILDNADIVLKNIGFFATRHGLIDCDFIWRGGHDKLISIAKSLCFAAFASTHARRGSCQIALLDYQTYI